MVAACLIGAAVTAMSRGGGESAADKAASAHATMEAAPLLARSPSPSTSPSASASSSSPSPSGKPSSSPSHHVDWDKPGTGRFSTAEASGSAVGHGRIRRYKVEVEQGTGVTAKSAAREIEAILADPRGWTTNGHDGFQLVSAGPSDFEVKIASPHTVDAICGAAGLDTHGEVNCDVGSQVMVNLKRWETGSPEFSGPVSEYRALIINHEVGHRIGHGHETCPGPGKPAPAMMQQIYGLHGCVANAWPYDSHGHYLGGPSVP